MAATRIVIRATAIRRWCLGRGRSRRQPSRRHRASIRRCRERLDERASEPNGGGWAVLLGVGHRIATGSTTREAPAPITVDHRTFLAPPGLTFPPDSRVTAVFPSDFATTVHLDPPEDAAIVAYFRERLPGWGYAMTNDNGTVLTAAGRGWAITVNAAMVIFGYSQEAAAALAPTDQDPSMWLTRADLGLRHAPLVMRYPAGTTATEMTDPESGASHRLAGHSPEEFLAFSRAHLTDMRLSFTAAAATTLRFTEEDGYISTSP